MCMCFVKGTYHIDKCILIYCYTLRNTMSTSQLSREGNGGILQRKLDSETGFKRIPNIYCCLPLFSVTFNPHSAIGFYYPSFIDGKTEAGIRFVNHHRLQTIMKYQSCDLNQC